MGTAVLGCAACSSSTNPTKRMKFAGLSLLLALAVGTNAYDYGAWGMMGMGLGYAIDPLMYGLGYGYPMLGYGYPMMGMPLMGLGMGSPTMGLAQDAEELDDAIDDAFDDGDFGDDVDVYDYEEGNGYGHGHGHGHGYGYKGGYGKGYYGGFGFPGYGFPGRMG